MTNFNTTRPEIDYKAEGYTLLTNKFLEVRSAKHFGRSNERASTK